MNTHEISEGFASRELLENAATLVERYTTHPGDIEAATKALLIVTLEHIFNRRIDIEQITR
jgi:hypothetical protein